MARPNVELRNRAPQASRIGRTSRAPGVEVQAPIVSTAGPSKLSELAASLQPFLNVGVQVVGQRQAEQRAEQRRLEVLTTTRAALEQSEALSREIEEWRRENPTGTPEDLDERLKERVASLFAEGGPLAHTAQNPALRAVVDNQLYETLSKLRARDREVYQKNVLEAGVNEATAAFLASARQNSITSADWTSFHETLKTLGVPPAQINTIIRDTAFALTDELGTSDPIKTLPDRWADGTPTVRNIPSIASELTRKAQATDARVEAEQLEARYMERFNFDALMRDQAAKGIAPTPEQLERGKGLGLSEDLLRSYGRQAAAALEAEQKEMEKLRLKLEEENAKIAKVSSDAVHQMSTKEVEDTLDLMMLERGYPAEVVLEMGLTKGYLPTSIRNRLSRVPLDVASFQQWHEGMSLIRQTNDQVYQSLPENARVAAEAYDAVMAAGSFTPEEAFKRIQMRDPKYGHDLVRSDKGRDLIKDVLGNNTTPYIHSRMSSLIQVFGSFQDLPREEALRLAKESFEATYFKHDGVYYEKALVPGPEYIEWAKDGYAEALNKTRRREGIDERVDPDDVVIVPVGDGGSFTFRIRNDLHADVLTADELRQIGWRGESIARYEAEVRARKKAFRRDWFRRVLSEPWFRLPHSGKIRIVDGREVTD